MRVVALPRDHVEADVVDQLEAGRVVDEARDDVLVEDLARELVAEVLVRPRLVVLVGEVDAVEEVRDPADAALGERELQVGELAEDLRPDEVGRGT